MKTLIIILIACFATFTSFAQKDKGKITSFKPPMSQSNYSCPAHHDVVSNRLGKCTKCNMDLALSKKEQMKKNIVKIYTCPMHTEVVINKSGKCTVCNSNLTLSKKEQMKIGVMKMYTCPMHGEVGVKDPDKCPKCGMALTKVKSEPRLKRAITSIDN